MQKKFKKYNHGNKTKRKTPNQKIMKRLSITILLVFQALYMLFAPTYCTCKESIYDLLWYVMIYGIIGIFCISERDISKVWTSLFRITGYISFFFCVMFIVTFNSNLISNYLFNLAIYSVYLISVIYLAIHTLIKSKR